MTLGKRNDFGHARFVGLQLTFHHDVDHQLTEASTVGFDFVLTPLIHGVITWTPSPPLSNLALVPNDLSNQVVGRVGLNGAEMLPREIDWAMHSGIHAVVLSLPSIAAEVESIARIISWKLDTPSCGLIYWIQIKLTSEQLGDGVSVGSESDPWDLWNLLRCLCDHHQQLGVLLELTPNLPGESFVARYYGEPIKAVLLPTECFVTNKKGFPALMKSHRRLVESFIQAQIQVVLSGPVLHSNPEESGLNGSPVGLKEFSVYHEYLSYLYRSLPPSTDAQILQQQYQDQLQLPLEPLKDNLESKTYEIFEKDFPKYDAYGQAIYQALCDWPYDEDSSVVVLMVLGAGRGPLVSISLETARSCGRRVRIYAIEKNPYAVVDLHVKAQQENWGEIVKIVHEDMRIWEAPEKADIIISELLGSFGDNELSPECLDGAQRFLKEEGISIPASYTSYCAPITSSRAYSMALAYKDPKKLETSFVVKFGNMALLNSPLPVFTFHHPDRSPAKKGNSRSVKLKFERGENAPACLMHGLAGYFTAVLYKEVSLSTVPGTHTAEMESWFSMFFPLQTPITIPRGPTTITVNFWRCTTSYKVWYEWAISEPIPTSIHNPNGRAISVGL